jgi:hypothetical protein
MCRDSVLECGCPLPLSLLAASRTVPFPGLTLLVGVLIPLAELGCQLEISKHSQYDCHRISRPNFVHVP